ncbi:MAG: CxxxxCH/CxxCH domain-containing protein [Acidobacteriota bacterium]
MHRQGSEFQHRRVQNHHQKCAAVRPHSSGEQASQEAAQTAPWARRVGGRLSHHAQGVRPHRTSCAHQHDHPHQR